MRHALLFGLCSCLYAGGCLADTLATDSPGAGTAGTSAGAEAELPEAVAPDAPAGAPPTATYSAPTPEQLRATAAALPRPWTVARVRVAGEGPMLLALAHRDGEQWMLGGLFDDGDEEELCETYPCPWPADLVPDLPLVEQPPLSGRVRDIIAYARTFLSFEGELNVLEDEDEQDGSDPDTSWVSDLPERSEDAAMDGDYAPFLDRLRRYHPHGHCSMDGWPQTVAQMRARAAAQAGFAGWAAQGWMDTVGYFSSRRVAWSSYGQRHPDGHLALLEMVGVEPHRFFAGVLFELPGFERRLDLNDARRVAPDFGPKLTRRLRELVADATIDPLNRARLFIVAAGDSIEQDPQYETLPPLSRGIVDHWLR